MEPQVEPETKQTNQAQDYVRVLMQLVALGTLIVASIWIVRPFLIAVFWAATVTISTWPLLLQVQAWVGGRRALAVVAMTLLLLLILLAPFYFAVTSITDNAQRIADLPAYIAHVQIPALPSWLAGLPIIGERLNSGWKSLASAKPDDVTSSLAPYARNIALWFLNQVGNLGLFLVQVLLTVAISAVLYARGESAAEATETFFRRLGGPRGLKAVRLASQAIRGVALGIVITAIVQALLAGAALAIAGIPFAAPLTAVMFILTVAQIGPG